jgi:hypothetical protein
VAAGICMHKAARNVVCDSMCTVLPFTQQRHTALLEQRTTDHLVYLALNVFAQNTFLPL